ncbi:MAG: hypothetical protein AAFR39_15075, partial [Pseudomonadota bacterium]
DPFAELLRLTEDATPEAEEIVSEEISAENQEFKAPQEDVAPVASAVEMPADLEEALLAELGVEPAPETVAESTDAHELDAALAEDFTEETPTEPVALDEEMVPPAPEVAPQPENTAPPSLEDELAALLGGEDADAVFEEQVQSVQAPVVEATLSDQEARALIETALADDAFLEQELAEDLADMAAIDGAASDNMDADPAQVDLEEAIAAEIEQTVSEQPDPLEVDPVTSETAATEAADLDIDALFENALADENIFDDLTEDKVASLGEQQEQAETLVGETDPLDELLGIMGDEPEETPAPLEAEMEGPEFAGELEAPAMAPALETQDIDLEVDLDLSEFDLGLEESASGHQQAANSQESGEDTYVVGSMAATEAVVPDPAPDLSLDDAFDEVRFEAELARDMEFVAHDAQTRNNDEFDDLASDLESDLAMSEFEPAPEEKNQRGLKIAAIVGSIAIAGALGLFLFAGGS